MNWALITGGSRGIGRATCVELAKSGYHILINFNSNKDEALKTLDLVREVGVKGEILGFDVANAIQVQETLGTWLEKNPENKIEVLVNNAGIKKDNLFMWMEKPDWDAVLDISFSGFFNVTKLVVNKMIAAKYGRIINVVSISGQKGVPGQTNYSTAKSGIIGATRSLAQEVGRRNITVNAVAPGFIKTEMTEGIDEKDYKKIIPVARFGTPEEVAHAISFLASKNASYITGEVLTVSGGI